MRKIRIYSVTMLLILLLSIPSIWASTTRIVQNNLSKIVLIITFDQHDQPLVIGSGFYISNVGEIATNYHIIEGASSAIVREVRSKRKYSVERVARISPEHDLAIIRINKTTKPVVLGDDEPLLVGERVIAIGNPKGLEGSVSEGIVSGFRQVSKDFRLIQITAPISPGSSGGPLFNSAGEVVGIATASIVSGQNLNFAILITTLRWLISRKPLNLRLNQIDFPLLVKKKNILTGPQGKELVRVIDYHYDVLDYLNVKFSIFNGSQNDVKNIRLIIVFFKGRWYKTCYKKISKYPLHFVAYNIDDVIPSRLSKRIGRNEALVEPNWVPEFRMLDYEILPRSRDLRFK